MDNADFLAFLGFVANEGGNLVFFMGSDVLEDDLFGVELGEGRSTVMRSLLGKKVELERLRSGWNLRVRSLSMGEIENKIQIDLIKRIRNINYYLDVRQYCEGEGLQCDGGGAVQTRVESEADQILFIIHL